MTIHHSLAAAQHQHLGISTSGIINTSKAVAKNSSSAAMTRATQADLLAARPQRQNIEVLQEKLSRLIDSFRQITRDIFYLVFELGHCCVDSWQTQYSLSRSEP